MFFAPLRNDKHARENQQWNVVTERALFWFALDLRNRAPHARFNAKSRSGPNAGGESVTVFPAKKRPA